MLTQAELKQLLHYDPETGLFTWLVRSAARVKIGDVAGGLNPDGYHLIKICGKKQLAHRLAWLYVYGNWPKNQIDHINRVKNDNKISNLRDVTQQQNQWNLDKRKDNTSGYPGVYSLKNRNKHRVSIYMSGKQISLGYFDCPQEAHNAYLRAKSELHII